jgi:hypothetical protein
VAVAADGADSPAAINRYAKALGGTHACQWTPAGGVAAKGSCRVVRDSTDARGIVTYRVTVRLGQTVFANGTLTPHMAGAYWSGPWPCSSAGGTAVAANGDLRRKGKRWWSGTVQASGSPAAPTCSAVELTIGASAP